MSRNPQWQTIIRFWQKVSAAFWFNLFTFLMVVICIILWIILLHSKYSLIAVAYYICVLLDDAPIKGYRMIPFIKNSKILKHARDYLSAKLIKTVDLDPSKNYLFAAFPHGAFGCGIFLSFTTDVLDFNKLFPGLTSRLMMHQLFFYVPFFREILMFFSACVCSKRSLRYLLNDENFKGNCTVLPVGGAREGLESEPGKHRVVLNKRKGFVHIAVQTGASLVPVYGFGETEIFRKTKFEEGTLMHKFQYWLLNKTGFMLIRLSGVGFFQDSFGWIPFRKPVNVVVGAPIEVKKNPYPSKEEIDALHLKFKDRLIDLFETHKSKYVENYENAHLEFVE